MEAKIEAVVEERKKKIFSFLSNKKDWIVYIILAFIVFIGTYIRTRNIPGLKDVTTGGWALAPDLDPYLFLRWAKYIVAHGTLMAHDMMRYVPLGYDTYGESKFLSYLIAYFYQIFSFFTGSKDVTYAAIWYPVIMFVFTAIAFFLFAQKIFHKEKKEIRYSIALVATMIFVLVPSFIPRSIAGIPGKESTAFGLMFLALYLFLEAFTAEKFRNKIILGVLSGIATGLMGLVWGGILFIFFTISPSMLIAFLFGKVKTGELAIYTSWILAMAATAMPFSTRFSFVNLIESTSSGIALGVLAILWISFFIMNFNIIEKYSKKFSFSKELLSVIISILGLFLIVLIIFGSGFTLGHINQIKISLITPQPSRFGLTVAENKQPYFINDWIDNYGPVFNGFPIFFWLFFVGSIVLFYNMIEKLSKKEKIWIILSYLIFLVCLIFSKYSSDSALNGTSGLSILMYFSGTLFFIGTFGYYYIKRCNKEEFSAFREINLAYILYFTLFVQAIIGARFGIRFMMFLGTVSPIVISFLLVKSIQKYSSQKEDMSKLAMAFIVAIISISLVFTSWNYYQQDISTASSYAPSAYNVQWQKAMSWVRGNTPENAVFAHWWDYGYWLQSIGNRATVLDGGNVIGYWDYLMGRLVLTGNESDTQQTLEFLYTHNTTHLLIDSTDIGKYTAFSSIGSDENYDRISYIPSMFMDQSQTKTNGNQTNYVYPAGFATDDDIILNDNGNQVFLPRKMAGIGAIILAIDNGKLLQPNAIFVYQGKQYNQKIRYVYLKNKLYDFNSGIDAGIFIYPKLDQSSDGKTSLNEFGAALYLSSRTVHSNLARFYLFDQKSDYFKLAHTESNLFVDNLKKQGFDKGEFVYFQGLQGPIKIWEVKYPQNIKSNPEYLKLDFPNPAVDIAKPGEY